MTIDMNTNQPRQLSEEEQYLSKRLAKGNPYKVPEGYFDQLTERVMQQIDESTTTGTKKPHTVKLRLWSAAAAVALVVGVSTTLFFHRETANAPQDQRVATVFSDNESDYLDEAADYLATDNNDIYAYLAYE